MLATTMVTASGQNQPHSGPGAVEGTATKTQTNFSSSSSSSSSSSDSETVPSPLVTLEAYLLSSLGFKA